MIFVEMITSVVLLHTSGLEGASWSEETSGIDELAAWEATAAANACDDGYS